MLEQHAGGAAARFEHSLPDRPPFSQRLRSRFVGPLRPIQAVESYKDELTLFREVKVPFEPLQVRYYPSEDYEADDIVWQPRAPLELVGALGRVASS